MWSKITFAAALLLAATAAQAQGNCGSRAEFVRQLAAEFEEQGVGIGMDERGHLIELFAAADGATWTIVATLPNGLSCIVAAGEHWQKLQALAGKPA